MKGQVDSMTDSKQDLAEFLQADVDKKRSVRKVAKEIGISKTALQNILKRQLKGVSSVETLEKIADHYEISLSAVIDMLGKMTESPERYVVMAREIERHPWVAERYDDLMGATEEQFRKAMEFLDFQRQKDANHLPPPDAE
jgi:transcriptional regulator with XRE-family HTH domain